jgi:hypothetical protein
VDPPPEGQPCPACGSIKQNIAIEVPVEGMRLRGEIGNVRIVDYPHVLLQEAETLIQHSQYGAAVMVAHIACEITVRQALSRALKLKGASVVEDPVLQLFNGYSLWADGEKRFYKAVTGDEKLTKEKFWKSYGESVQRRNAYAHKGIQGGEAEARESLKACTAFVEHVSRV